MLNILTKIYIYRYELFVGRIRVQEEVENKFKMEKGVYSDGLNI